MTRSRLLPSFMAHRYDKIRLHRSNRTYGAGITEQGQNREATRRHREARDCLAMFIRIDSNLESAGVPEAKT